MAERETKTGAAEAPRGVVSEEVVGAGRPKRRGIRRLVIALVVTLVTVGGVLGLHAARTGGDAAEAGEPAAEPENTAVPVEVAEVRREAVASYISATANLVPENEVEVLAEWEGRLARLLVEEGRWVEKGETLAELAQGDAPMALEKAKMRLRNAELAYDRTARLADEGLVAPQERDKAVMELGVARQELAEAEWRIEKSHIRAPFAGQVTRRSAQPGQDVRLGDPLFTVAQLEPLVARIYLSEKDVLALTPDRPVRLVLKADESVEFRGRIDQISPVVDPATGTVKVTVEAVRPPRQARPGAFVRVDVVKEERADALLVPKEAVVRELQKTYVFVADEDVARKREVALGLEEGALVQAVSGLAAGERVIVAGQGALQDGAAIKLPGIQVAEASVPR